MARLSVVPDVESELDQLFALPLEDFTAARNELASRLKGAGQTESAERVRELRKPSVPAWAVNQLARRQPEAVGRLVDAGERLRKAQAAALAGGEAAAVREATAAERDAVRELTRLSERVLEDARRKPTQAVVERIGRTLRAAAVDAEAAALLALGQLTGEVDSPGFTAVAAIAPPPSNRRPAKRAARDEAAKRAHEQRVRRLEQRFEKLERRAEDAAARAERAEADAIAAREAAEAAADELRLERERGPG
jgi:hypothetical protein